MIYKNNIERIKKWNKDNIYIVTDFDRTLTMGSSESSWGVLTKCHVLPEDYEEKRKALFDYYYPIEKDLKISDQEKNMKMIEWWTKHISLLIEYKFQESMFMELLQNNPVMIFRDGVKELLKELNELNVPVIIISAGLGDFIIDFLKINDCLYDNIYIDSNFFEFNNGLATKIKGEIVHSMNKNVVSLPDYISKKIINRPNAILLGDNISDLKMISEKEKDNTLKIGFLDYNTTENLDAYLSNFDIVCTDETSMNELIEFLKVS